MERNEKVVSAQVAADLGGAGTLAVAGFLGLWLYGEGTSPTGGDVIAFLLWSLAAAVAVRAVLLQLW